MRKIFMCRPDWGYIMEFFVKKTHRRKGIGKKLVDQCEKFFEGKDVKNIWLAHRCANFCKCVQTRNIVCK